MSGICPCCQGDVDHWWKRAVEAEAEAEALERGLQKIVDEYQEHSLASEIARATLGFAASVSSRRIPSGDGGQHT